VTTLAAASVTLIDTVGRWVAVPATLGLLLLLPLYLSQRRDIARLYAWMAQEPNHPVTDLAASEALLDRAEADLEALLVDRGEPATAVQAPPPSAPAETGTTPIPAALRVTAERPALERITMERAALEPHPRWRRFAARLTRPRTLVIITLAAVTLGVAALIGSHAILGNGNDNGNGKGGGHNHGPSPVVPSQIAVAVLNGTSTPGLAAPVGRTLRENGFHEGAISATRKQYQQTVVMYGGGDKRAAERVAQALGVTPIQRIDRTTRAIAGNAPVVVIVGADRTRH
jgi:LytR cell envelope-related transcriptional attenuator